MGDASIDKFVSFRVGNEMFAASINKVREIIRMTNIVEVPKAPRFIRGVINLRGSVIPVVDLKTKFDIPSGDDGKDARIIIAELGNLTIGLVVDAVSEVLQVDESSYEESPQLLSGGAEKFISGVVKKENQMIMVIDIDSLLTSDEASILKTVK